MYIYTQFLRDIYEYRTKVPNTEIRFRWTSCRGTMHQTLITDRGRPKNRYPYNLSVRVSCAKPVDLNIIFVHIFQSYRFYNHLTYLHLIATLQCLTYSRYHPPISQPIPTDTQKPWQICLESPAATTALDCIMRTHICNLFPADDADIQQENCNKLQKDIMDRRSRRAQHRQRMLANKIATYSQDDDANSSSSLSSSYKSEWPFHATFWTKNSISRSIAEEPAIAEYTQVWRITKHW